MKMLKRTLALMLVLCMMFTAVPFNAFATESTDAPSIPTEAPVDAPEVPADPEKDSEEEVVEEPVDDAPDAETPDNGIAIASLDDGIMTAAEKPSVPSGGHTTGEPFPQGTGGSNSFRIPALVTLSDGTLVAAADARWNSTLDNGGIDTIVSRSTDSGANWDFYFANYLGDNGNEYNQNSTCFIDPAMAVTSNDTIYMLVDLYPYGVAIAGSSAHRAETSVTGFGTDATAKSYGKLLLSNNDHTSYDYYLDGTVIRDADGNAVDGYTVDSHFNLSQNGTYVSNLFFSDSPYKVQRTGYLYLTKSTDMGVSWSSPMLLNLKKTNEMSCLVGPGRGLVTSNGVIVFPVYSYTDSAEYTSLVYSTDGQVWYRSNSLTSIDSSEAAVVELPNGQLRVFFRNHQSRLCYADYNFNSGWSGVTTTTVPLNSNTQLSAITYSQKINNKPVILVSAPAGAGTNGSADNSGSARLNGRIFGFTLESNNDMTLLGSVKVNDGGAQFMYSCLAELSDKSVGILYEDKENAWGGGDNRYYYTMEYDAFSESALETAFNAEFGTTSGGDTGDTDEDAVTITLNVGETKTETITGAALTGSHSSAAADVSWTGTTTEGSTTQQLVAATSITSDSKYYISDGNGNFLSLSNQRLTNTTSRENATQWTITYVDTRNGASRYTIRNGNYKIALSGSTLYVTNGNKNVNHYFKPDVGFYGSGDGSNAWIYNNGWTVGTANNNAAKAYTLETVTTPAGEATTIAFTGKAIGNTSVEIGGTTYNVVVTKDGISNIVDIEVEEGETFTYTDTTGNFVDNIVQQPDSTVATMDVSGSTTGTTKKLVPVTAATFDASKKYVLENTRAADGTPEYSVLTSTESDNGLLMNGPADVNTSQTWTITPSDNNYSLGRADEFVSFYDGSAYMQSTAYELTFTYVNGSGWMISYDGNNLSDYGGDSASTSKGYWDENDAGNYWNIYEVVEETSSNATVVSFTGKKAGETTNAVVGTTQYNISVVARTIDDEIQNSGTNMWTVDPEVQRDRYYALVGLNKDLYTDESWANYEAARQEAYKQLTQVSHATYGTQAEADAALKPLTEAIDELATQKGALVEAKTISVRYTLDGTVLDTREYKVTSTDTSLELPASIVVDDVAYSVDTTELTLGVDTTYEVSVTKVGKLGGGFVGSADINAGSHNGHTQTAAVASKKITEMTITTGISYDLNLATSLTTGQTVEWTTGDDSVATVDQNGNVTAVNAGTTTIVATIKNADGTVAEVNSIPITVYPSATTDRTSAIYIEEVSNTTVWCVVNADTNSRTFEVVEGELIYGKFDTQVSDNTYTTAFSFFGDPDEAHALVYMKSTGSDDHYFLLHDDDGNLYDGTATPNANYYVSGQTSGAGYWQAVGLSGNQTGANTPGWSTIKDMVQWAINKGCDGGLGFTRRQSEGAIGSNLRFASDPMPRIEKTVDGVLPTTRKQADYRTYTENMVAAVNELVYFKITVTQEVPTVWTDDAETVGAITYSNAMVTDTILPGAYLYNQKMDQDDGSWDGEIPVAQRTQEDEITKELNSAWTTAQKTAGKRTFEYYLVYEIQESDIPKFFIDNIANLAYGYKSHYSTGAQAGAADANATIRVVGTAIDDVVIDFGQTITYTGLENVHLKDVFTGDATQADAQYGTVRVEKTQKKDANGNPMFDDKAYPLYDYTVTYTPTTVLQGVDSVLLYGKGDGGRTKVINGFRVYPATTVYYEEGFMLNGDSTMTAGNPQKATGEQTFELLGKSQFDEHGQLTHKITDQKHVYGYDPLYATEGYDYGDSYIGSKVPTGTDYGVGEATTFTFTGTGFDLYANCTDATGTVAVMVTNSAGACVKYYTVNTVSGFTDIINNTDTNNEEFHLPIVSEQGLDHGTYTVTITKIMKNGAVKLDGVRIFNTVEDHSVFGVDLEDNPEFYQLRDYVQRAVGTKTEDYDDDPETDYVEKMPAQVYGELSADTETPLTAAIIDTNDANVYAGETTAQTLLDKGPKNELFLYKNQTLTFKVKTAREMQIGLKAPVAGTSYSMAVTGLDTKTGSVNTSVDMFYPIGNTIGTEQEYTISITNTGSNILSVTDLKICDDPSFAFAPLTVEDIAAVMGVVEEPEAPEETTKPTEPEVEETTKPTKPQKPSKPSKPGKPENTKPTEPQKPGKPENTKPTEPQKPGKPGNNGNQKPGKEEKTYTLKITFVNLFGKKVGTATITTTSGVVSAYEIVGKAPARYNAIWFIPVTLNAHGTNQIVVPVI